jgi:hypothetical protein
VLRAGFLGPAVKWLNARFRRTAPKHAPIGYGCSTGSKMTVTCW